MLSKVASSTILWVFGMIQSWIEPCLPRSLVNTLLSMLLLCWLYFFINSSCYTNSIDVSIVKLTLWSVSNNFSLKAWSYMPSIKHSMINSSFVVISLVLSLSNLPYLALSCNQCMNCTIDSSGCCLVSRNFVLSVMTNLFFGLIFLLITSLISLKVISSRFLG